MATAGDNSADKKLAEPGRLHVLQQTRLLDRPAEEAFDRLTRLASRLLNVPIALVSLVDKDRQFFKSQVGLPDHLATTRQTPLSHSFCKHVVLSAEPLIVRDAREHPILKDNPIIADGVIAYAGVPLITTDGLVLGSFCAIDTQPRDWTTGQISDLHDFAAAAMTEIELRRSSDAKDHFIAMLSHELRMPLSPALLTATALLANPNLPQQCREDVQLIQRNIELETRMIDTLLDITRISSGKLQLHIEDVDLHALLHATVKMHTAAIRTSELSINFDLRATQYHVKGDAAKLQQVLSNLLTNAVKFSRTNGQVACRTRDAEGSLNIEITDTGVGIADSAIPYIFDSFQQGGNHVTQEFGGLGLGLAICKGTIIAHGGTISATSEGPGKGVTMSVLLPGACPPPRSTPALDSTKPAGSRTFSILLVEDHQDTLKIMSRLLRSLQHKVVTASSVATAVQAAATEKFDYLISDLGLPDGTGLDLLQQLGDRRPAYGIALTGYGMEEDIQRTKNAGFQRHLTKPINFQELQTAIEEIAR